MDKNFYIIAGCNGAGKTTASFTILPEILDCKEYVNADEIARGLSPFQPEKAAIEAGKIMLKRISELMKSDQNFAVETTLATKIYKQKILEAKQNDFKVTLIFFWLESIELAKERVKTRVSEGGHNIPPDIITRRYKGGIDNLVDIYLDICDEVLIFDNSRNNQVKIAIKNNLGELIIDNLQVFDILKNKIYEKG